MLNICALQIHFALNKNESTAQLRKSTASKMSTAVSEEQEEKITVLQPWTGNYEEEICRRPAFMLIFFMR